MPKLNHKNSIGGGSAMELLPDEEIIRLIRQGQTTLYELIMRRYNQRLFRIARSILKDNDAALDAMQEAYFAAFQKLDSYQSTGKLGAWLSRITINEALMIKRKPDNTMTNKSDSLDFETLKAQRANPLGVLENKELAGLIETAIDGLPDEFRVVFVLRAIQQLSVQETADSLDLNESTVKTRFLRAREKMQQILNKHIEDAGLNVFEFAGSRCDQVVQLVMERIAKK